MPGARNSGQDLNRIKRIHSLAGDIRTVSEELGAVDGDADPAIVAAKAADVSDSPGASYFAPSNTSSVKAITDGEEWLLDVLGVPFGSASDTDADRQWFDRSTKFHLDRFSTPPVVYYHGFAQRGVPAGDPEYIGATLSHRVTPEGIWYRVRLDQDSEYSKRVWEAAKQGTARASSGSIAHLTRIDPSGHIRAWPVAELSVFDTAGGKQPANRYAVAVPATKALYATAHLPFDIEALEQELGSAGDEQSDPKATGAPVFKIEKNKEFEMDENGVKELVASAVAEALKAEAAQVAAKQAQAAAVQEQIDAALKAQRSELEAAHEAQLRSAAASRRLPGGADAPAVLEFGNLGKFADTSIDDLAILAGVLSAAKMAGRGPGPSEDLRRAIAVRIADSAEGDEHIRTKSAMKALGMPMKANELNRSTLATYGDEWVSVAYSSTLWDKIRLNTPVVANIPTVVVPPGAESVVIPLSGASPTFYKVAQTSAQDANPGRVTPTMITSKRGTGSQTLTVAKLGAAVNYTGELEEDSLIAWAPELRMDMTNEAAEVLEHIVIDGDTETGASTNINDIAGTPAGTEAFMLMNGFRKLALVTNTANSRDAGTLSVEDYLETVKLMGLGGRNAVDKTKVGILVDMWTHWKTLTLEEVKTRDVFAAPTIEGGMLTSLFGYKITATPNMHRANQDATYGLKANSAGKINLDTASANTTGAILAVRWDQWRLGFKRRMAFEMLRDPLTDSTLIVVTMRVGMINRDNEASAISYNVTL